MSPRHQVLACRFVIRFSCLHCSRCGHTRVEYTLRNNNNKNTIWRGSVLSGEEPPPHSGELKHALTQAGGPTQSQLSRPVSSGHHISMEHRLRRKHILLNPDTNARKERKKEKHSKQKKKEKKRKKRGGKKGRKKSKKRPQRFFFFVPETGR